MLVAKLKVDDFSKGYGTEEKEMSTWVNCLSNEV